MGVKGFQKGHVVSEETRLKISNHDDYDKPLEVRWLCFKCHRAYHKLHDNPELIGGEANA